jgi:hypothetical protein
LKRRAFALVLDAEEKALTESAALIRTLRAAIATAAKAASSASL